MQQMSLTCLGANPSATLFLKDTVSLGVCDLAGRCPSVGYYAASTRTFLTNSSTLTTRRDVAKGVYSRYAR